MSVTPLLIVTLSTYRHSRHEALVVSAEQVGDAMKRLTEQRAYAVKAQLNQRLVALPPRRST